MATFTINGQRVYAREEGHQHQQVALLIHGWSSSWYALSTLIPLLSKRFHVLAVDLPGYGNSPPMSRRATIDGYADLLADLIQEVSDNPIVLIGHSMGGMISLNLALRHPVLVERMVLLCPTISGHLSTYINWMVTPFTLAERFSLIDRFMGAMEPYLLSLTDRIMRPASFAERTQITEEDYKRLRADARRAGQGRVRAECYWAMREGDLRGKLHEIECPFMVIWGAEDSTVPLRDAGVLVDESSNSDLRIIPRAGHWPQFEMPDITSRYVASYLGLPLVTTRLEEANSSDVVVSKAALFLAHSDVGNGLNLAQRTRLASQCMIRSYEPLDVIAKAQDTGTDLYIVQEGTVEVWSDPLAMSQKLRESRCLATLLPGQITGELALLDGGRRSASLQAGSEGAQVMTLSRERLVSLIDDDPALGNRVMWNIATTLALRLRLTNWQMHQANEERQLETAS